MTTTKGLIQASLQAGIEWVQPATGRADGAAPPIVPIRALGHAHRARIREHLLALSPEDRYLRFGYSATDEQIGRYVDGLNFKRDELFGIFNRRLKIVAMAHLALDIPADADPLAGEAGRAAEFGVSVAADQRGRGLGKRLFERAVVHARNEGVSTLIIHALSENAPMLAIARSGGAIVEHDGPDSEARLTLPGATLDTLVSELIEEQIAQADYRIKRGTQQIHRLVRPLKPGGLVRREASNESAILDASQPVPEGAVDASTDDPPGSSSVPDPNPAPGGARSTEREDKRSLLRKLAEFIHPGPDSKDELISSLAEAEDRELIEPESRKMLEGVIRMADMTAGDAMVAAPRMDMIDIEAPFDETLNLVIETAHSRFPVYDGERENIIGILLAKDLLKLQRAPELNLRTLVRPAVFVPESKGLNDLLREFRNNRNHLAIAVDEFGRVSGLVTIEDVLEEIVGEIEDEFDTEADAGDVFGLADRTYRVSGDASIERVEEAFGVKFNNGDESFQFDTIGGLIAHEMGHVPRRGEHHTLAGLHFQALHTRGGAVRWFKVAPARPAPIPESAT